MGYNAYTLDVDFTVPADKVADALAAFNTSLTDDPDEPGGYTSLADAAADHGFECAEDPAGDGSEGDGFKLGWYPNEKYHDDLVVAFLAPIAPFAADGSFARFQGEDDCLWGFRVADGKLEEETGVIQWQLWKDIRAANKAAN